MSFQKAPAFSLIETPTVGLEDLQRAAFWVFVGGMNNAIEQMAEYWLRRDEAYDRKLGTHFAPTTLEYIECENFHEGHKPSLVNGWPEMYPNLAVFAMKADPAADSNMFDQSGLSWIDTLLVEIMVKVMSPRPSDVSGDAEVICNRRIQRTVEAAVLCLRRNWDLGGASYGQFGAPSIIISDLFAVRNISQGGAYPGEAGPRKVPRADSPEGPHSGSRYVWQGAQITFRVQKDAPPPRSGPDTFARASQIDYSQFIDQG